MRLPILLYFTLQLGFLTAQTFNLNLDNNNNLELWQSMYDNQSNNSIVVMGMSGNFEFASEGLYYQQYDYNGALLNSITYGEAGLKYYGGVVVHDESGNDYCIYQVTDTTVSEFYFYNGEIIIFKINEEGILWTNTIIDTLHIEATLSAIVENDTLYMTGFRNYQPEQHTSTFLYKISPTGDSLALFTYSHPDWNFIGNKIIRAQNGDFLIAGYAMDGFERDRLLLRIAPNGDLLWYQIYPGEDYVAGTYDAFMDIIELEDGNLIAAGRYTDYLFQNANLVKLNAAGEIIWDMSWGEENNDWFEAMELRNDTLFLGGNWRSGFESGYIDAWITAMDTAGNVYWSHTYNPDGIPDNAADDYLYDFTLTGDGGMAFCGWSRRETQDAWVMKLDANGLCDTASCFPDLVNIYQNVLQGNPTPRVYPNPADDFIFIQSAITKNVAVQIWNIHGSLVLENKLAGNITSLNITHLPSGIYAARFISDGEIFGEQMFVVE
ncbi:MAG: T9SS type A sorting domain-containing protein [Bacteroidetes bacterium]|nr:T9SS type A sorting domain-containing protein [Bacteroidota bacterium]